MLEAIRSRAKGWVAWTIVIFISIPFMLWGVDQFFQGEKVVQKAQVGDVEITEDQFLRQLSQEKNQLRQRLGENYDTLVKEDALRQEVMDMLIEQAIWENQAQQNGMMISDNQLSQVITSASIFFTDGKFDAQKYEMLLLQNGFSKPQFENLQRLNLLIGQAQSLVAANSHVSQLEMDQLMQIQGQERQAVSLTLKAQQFEAAITPEEVAVQDYYDNHHSDFQIPEKVAVDYIRLTQADLEKDISVTPEELQSYYQAHLSDYATQEERQASHILIQVGKDAPEADISAAQSKAEELLAKLKAGEDFAALAKEHSQDPGSAAQGGDLGFFGKGMMVPEFEQAVWSTDKGQLSGLVRSDFGFHLIKVTDVRPASQKSLDEVKDEVQRALVANKAKEIFGQKLEQMSNLAYEQPDSLDAAAQGLGLNIQSTEAFSRLGALDDLTQNEKFRNAAFSDQVLKEKLNSEAVDLGGNDVVIMHHKSYEAPRLRPLTEVKEAVVAALKRELALNQAQELAKNTLADLQAGKITLEAVKQDSRFNVQDLGWISRAANPTYAQVARAIFKLPKPKAEEWVFGLEGLPQGDQVILALHGVRQGQVQDDKLKAQLTEALNSIHQNAAADAAVKVYREKTTITGGQL